MNNLTPTSPPSKPVREALNDLILEAAGEILELYDRAHRSIDDPVGARVLIDMATKRKEALDSLWEAARTLVDS